MFTRDLERHANRYYGKFSGIVSRNTNDDPEEKLGRVWVRVPAVFGDEVEVRARPCFPAGHFMVPNEGTKVWVEFEAGDPEYPIWSGVWYTEDEVPETAAITPPDNRVIKTPSGHTIELFDKEGEEKIVIKHMKESFLSIDKEGSVVISNDKGSFLHLDSKEEGATLMEQHGNLISMNSDGVLVVNASGVTLEMKDSNLRVLSSGNVQISAAGILLQGQTVGIGEGATEPALLGRTFLNTVYGAHTHATAMGPTGPPLPPAATMELVALAQVAKVK